MKYSRARGVIKQGKQVVYIYNGTDNDDGGSMYVSEPEIQEGFQAVSIRNIGNIHNSSLDST